MRAKGTEAWRSRGEGRAPSRLRRVPNSRTGNCAIDRAAPCPKLATLDPRRAARRRASRSMPSTSFPSRGSMHCATARRSPVSRAAAAACRCARRFRARSYCTTPARGCARASRATSPRLATQFRRTRNKAGRRAGRAIWPRRFHRARLARPRPQAASPRRRARAKVRPSMARSARGKPRALTRPRRWRGNLRPVRSAVEYK